MVRSSVTAGNSAAAPATTNDVLAPSKDLTMTLKFGNLHHPFHCPVGLDPTAAYERDLEVIQHMDKLGFEEASAGAQHVG